MRLGLQFRTLLEELPSEKVRQQQPGHRKTERAVGEILLGKYGIDVDQRQAILDGDLELAAAVGQRMELNDAAEAVGLVVLAESDEDRYLHQISEAARLMITEAYATQAA